MIVPIAAVIVMTKLGFIGVGLTAVDDGERESAKDNSRSTGDKSIANGKVRPGSTDIANGDVRTGNKDISNGNVQTGNIDISNGNVQTGNIDISNKNETGNSGPGSISSTAGSETDVGLQDTDDNTIPEFIIKAPQQAADPSGSSGRKNALSYIIRASVILASLMLYFITVFSLRFMGTDPNSPYDLYHNCFLLDLGVQKLGIITSAGLDIKNTLTDPSSDLETLDNAVINGQTLPDVMPVAGLSPVPTANNSDTLQNDNSKDPGDITDPDQKSGTTSDGQDSSTAVSAPAVSPTATPLPTPTPVPIDTSPNVLDIDFASLAEKESKKEIKSLHEYFANSEPTRKNKYTGMFKGYNFIYLTCEGYSPWAVDEKVTPTLYKLTHSGFIFKNFYNPIWYTSTSDGEYVECIGLLPYNSNSFKRSKNNALPFCFGWQFLKLGYTSRAYHAHTVTYYGRNETHPNMGYIFKAKRGGLPITDVWPESDLEMMQLSLPEYINDEHFHAYYMTVSGHLEYSFNDNTQARKNKEFVDDLPYSNEVKAYIACNAELDKALAYLIDELEKAGKLDNTVIAFGADHYPYGLSDEAIDEIAGEHVDRDFELYRNNFVIWNSQIKEPIVVEKYGSGLDMMPTLSNLFGLEFDSRLFMGSDLLSDAPGLVIFGNQSFITDICKYNSKTHKVEMLADVELPAEYIRTVSRIVQNKFTVSKNILLNDYYRYIMDYIPGVVTKVPES